MSSPSKDGKYDPFNVKYLLAAVVTALAFPLMHVALGISVFL